VTTAEAMSGLRNIRLSTRGQGYYVSGTKPTGTSTEDFGTSYL